MKSPKSPKVPLVIATVSFAIAALFLTSCRAMEDMLPATQGDIAQSQMDSAAGQAIAMEGVEEGNLVKTVFGGLFSTISAIAAGVAMSRRRRAPRILAAKASKMEAARTQPPV